MKTTTVRVPDGLLEKAKKVARDRGTTVTALIVEGLQSVVARPAPAAKRRVNLPVSKATGGLRPGIDPVKLLSVMDELDDLERYGALQSGRAAS